MRIAHFIYDDVENPWLGGGGSHRVLEIYKRISNKHTITVYTGNFPGAKKKTRDGILFKRLGKKNNYLMSRTSYTIEARGLTRNIQTDIIIESFSPYAPIICPLYTSIPTVGLIHNYHSSHAIHNKKILGIIGFFFERFGLRNFENIIAVSKGIANKIVKDTGKKRSLSVIHGGISFTPSKSISIKSDNYLFFIGRLQRYQKGLDILMSSLRYLQKMGREITLKIAGKGPDEKWLKSKARELNCDVEFLGWIEGQDKEKMYKNALCTIVPSRFEGQPQVVVESQAHGTPVIGANIAGIRDTLIHGKTGFLHKKGDPESLSDTIMSYLSLSKKEVNHISRNALEWSKRFNWDDSAAKFEEIIYSLGRR